MSSSSMALWLSSSSGGISSPIDRIRTSSRPAGPTDATGVEYQLREEESNGNSDSRSSSSSSSSDSAQTHGRATGGGGRGFSFLVWLNCTLSGRLTSCGVSSSPSAWLEPGVEGARRRCLLLIDAEDDEDDGGETTVLRRSPSERAMSGSADCTHTVSDSTGGMGVLSWAYHLGLLDIGTRGTRSTTLPAAVGGLRGTGLSGLSGQQGKRRAVLLIGEVHRHALLQV